MRYSYHPYPHPTPRYKRRGGGEVGEHTQYHKHQCSSKQAILPPSTNKEGKRKARRRRRRRRKKKPYDTKLPTPHIRRFKNTGTRGGS